MAPKHLCEICGEVEPDDLEICYDCERGLTFFHRKISRLYAAADYLVRQKKVKQDDAS